MNLIAHLNEQFILPVIREQNAESLSSICLALVHGGLQILEVALMSDAAFAVIEKLAGQSNLIIGAGTVVSISQANKAIDHGAKFLVSPVLKQDVLQLASDRNIPYVPGVLSPTEIMQAQALNCELIKIFPITAVGGAKYLKTLSGPFPNLNCMASGGVALQNLTDYLNAKATCVGLGVPLMSALGKSKVCAWQTISDLANSYLHAVKTAKSLMSSI